MQDRLYLIMPVHWIYKPDCGRIVRKYGVSTKVRAEQCG